MSEKKEVFEKLKCLITIVDRGIGDKLTDIYKDNYIPYHFTCLGHGTASSEVLDYLGLGETEKDIIFSIIPARMARHVMYKHLNRELEFHKAGTGVACTIPVTSINRFIAMKITESIENIELEEVKEEGDVNMNTAPDYELIITIVTQGFADEAMEAAVEAGARGGTVIHARGLGGGEAEKFWGIIIEPEKEILLIIAKKSQKAAIMDSISKHSGLKTTGRGICFSLPVDDTIGIDAESMME